MRIYFKVSALSATTTYIFFSVDSENELCPDFSNVSLWGGLVLVDRICRSESQQKI
jgi:hypothetical protein